MGGIFSKPATKGANQAPQVRDMAAFGMGMSAMPQADATQMTGANPQTVARLQKGDALLTSGAATGEKKALLGG